MRPPFAGSNLQGKIIVTTTHFGKLEKVDLRDAWQTEAGDFTPWLAQEHNIRMLADTIGIELEIEAQEKQVGPFRADILCKDVVNDHWVLIENQLEQTDHTHLGQLLTYAAGLNTVTIVWVAKSFRAEHRAAMDWLNEMTGEDIAFFALEVELWRIGDSPVAPKFNVVCSPNDWVKSVSQAAKQAQQDALTPKKQVQLEFWTKFREHCETRPCQFKPTKALAQHWMNIAAGKSGLFFTAIASFYDSEAETFEQHELRAELSINTSNAKEHFQVLFGQREAIEEAMQEKLEWQNREDRKSCKIYIRRSANLEQPDCWSGYFEWLCKKLDRMNLVFRDRIKNLDDILSAGDL